MDVNVKTGTGVSNCGSEHVSSYGDLLYRPLLCTYAPTGQYAWVRERTYFDMSLTRRLLHISTSTRLEALEHLAQGAAADALTVQRGKVHGPFSYMYKCI